MPEAEVLKFVVQMGLSGIFFWLFWVTNQRLQASEERHDADIKALYEMRVNELKLIAKLPTDLIGSKPA